MIVALLGPNGAGKSTLLKSIAGLLRHAQQGRAAQVGAQVQHGADQTHRAGRAYPPGCGRSRPTTTRCCSRPTSTPATAARPAATTR
ncbi:MAG: ATP-binding cassette domain-containing protein, partial [Candidatus Rokubacteria bacterium]|nr:ATP-binding cassette domain-containing protein [Candidatus Rokubacteria bacterium]